VAHRIGGRGYLRRVPTRNPHPTAAPFMPDRLTMAALRDAVQRCEGCPLYANATQAVFGEGALTSDVMLVGEQPGDQEDRAGAPFVGPAGRLLDRALEASTTSRAGRSRWHAGRGLRPRSRS
jgi:uracil-DNA glycosylase